MLKSLIFIGFSFINFFFWHYVGRSIKSRNILLSNCPDISYLIDPSPCSKSESITHTKSNIHIPMCGENARKLPSFRLVETKDLMHYKDKDLAPIRYPDYSLLVNNYPLFSCKSFINTFHSQKTTDTCLIIVNVKTNSTYNLIRFNEKWLNLEGRLASNTTQPSGFFKKAGSINGREKLAIKLNPFLQNLNFIETLLLESLQQNNFQKGDNIILMVVNEGEIDLLLNFICSCYINQLPINNVIVIAASEEIVPSIQSTGVICLYHSSFAFVSRIASAEYLDSVFVDMMWYKSFSLYLLLKLGYHVLFQDVDLVWFRDPFPYFYQRSLPYQREHQEKSFASSPPDGYFSDDGQRSMRFTPMYANSGFYYITASPRSAYFAWTVMTAFDILQVSGSHQNVFTLRLIEAMDGPAGGFKPRILSLYDFPNGRVYHHDRPYMMSLRDGNEQPYNFHMCWTKNKTQKITNFKRVSMWYLREERCPLLGALSRSGEHPLPLFESGCCVSPAAAHRFDGTAAA